MSLLKSLIFITLLSIILGLVIYYTEPPKSLFEASITQLLMFFLPFYLLITFLSNLLLKSWLKSLILSLAGTILIALQGLNSLNLLNGLIIIVGGVLII